MFCITRKADNNRAAVDGGLYRIQFAHPFRQQMQIDKPTDQRRSQTRILIHQPVILYFHRQGTAKHDARKSNERAQRQCGNSGNTLTDSAAQGQHTTKPISTAPVR